MQTEISPTPTGLQRSIAMLGFGGAVAGSAAYGARFAGGKSAWYRTRRKPPFQPPAWVFAPAWTVLYALIAFSGYRVWRRKGAPGRGGALRLWALQQSLNAAWSKFFFGDHRPALALADLGALWLAVASYTRKARLIDRPAALAMVPYLGWLTFAGALNEEIVRRNR